MRCYYRSGDINFPKDGPAYVVLLDERSVDNVNAGLIEFNPPVDGDAVRTLLVIPFFQERMSIGEFFKAGSGSFPVRAFQVDQFPESLEDLKVLSVFDKGILEWM